MVHVVLLLGLKLTTRYLLLLWVTLLALPRVWQPTWLQVGAHPATVPSEGTVQPARLPMPLPSLLASGVHLETVKMLPEMLLKIPSFLVVTLALRTLLACLQPAGF